MTFCMESCELKSPGQHPGTWSLFFRQDLVKITHILKGPLPGWEEQFLLVKVGTMTSQVVGQSQDMLVCKMLREGRGYRGKEHRVRAMASKVLEKRARDQGSGVMLLGVGHHEVRVTASSDLSHPLRTRVCVLTRGARYGFG